MGFDLPAMFRLLPQFKGKTRLGRLFFERQIDSARNVVVAGKFGCSYNLPNLKEILALEIFLHGIYEYDTHEFLIGIIPKNAVVLDVGANIGSISIPLAKRRPDLKFVCIEASPFVFDYLQRNVKLNALEDRITLVNKAVSDKDDEAIPFYSAPDDFGKGSFSPLFTQDSIMVQTITIDKLLRELNLATVDFVKADIEGYEYYAFKGGSKLFSKPDAPPVFFEFVDWAERHAKLKEGAAQELLLSYAYNLCIHQNSQLKRLPAIMTKEAAMLYASKK